MTERSTRSGIRLLGAMAPRFEEVLTPEALAFVSELEGRFGPERAALLARRAERQEALDSGEVPDFLDETRGVRESHWRVPPAPPGLIERQVEITGPTERRMAVNALNSGASVWMADFEDANAPSWDNLVGGQLNLQDVYDRRIDFETEEGREYRLGERLATVVVRPRGWHLVEKHVLVDGAPVSASLFDFGLYAFHCARRPVESRPPLYFYLPKTESHLEARLWHEVFSHAEDALSLARGSIRATVLIETVLAAFEMDEILHELGEHATGLNAGRWDYLFSLIKKFAHHGGSFVLPDRNSVTMAAPFMRAYTELLVATCHRRGAHAIGGMAAFIPSRRDPEVNALAMAKVREDKEREVRAGFDGSWVAHPDLVPLCREVFAGFLGDAPNQLERQRDDVVVGGRELLDLSSLEAEPTEAGLRNDISVALQYLAAWLKGSGAVAIFNLMEDVATAEIARSQVWQWLRYEIVLSNGEIVGRELVEKMVDEELDALRAAGGADFDEEAFATARELFSSLVYSEDFVEFLTVRAYEQLD